MTPGTPSNLTDRSESIYKALGRFWVWDDWDRRNTRYGLNGRIDRTWGSTVFEIGVEYWDEDTIGVRVDWE